MNKKNGVKHLGKPADQRNALVKSQVKDFLGRGFIRTTKTRGKAISQRVDILLAHLADKNTKEIKEYLNDNDLTAEVVKFDTKGKRSGFVSMIPIKNRAGDRAELVLLELIK